MDFRPFIKGGFEILARQRLRFSIRKIRPPCINLYYMSERQQGGEQMVRISDFQVKDVVSISDGRKLGNVEDIDINLDNGTIESIIVGGSSGKMFGLFGKEDEVVIPWSNIVKIGTDVILVRFKESAYTQQQLQEPRK